MEIKGKIKQKKSLKDFIRLTLAFLFGLFFVALVQQIRLFNQGYIDQIWSSSTAFLLLNHLGFTAVVTLVLLFPFKLLEQKSNALGFQLTKIIFWIILGLEVLLTEYYLRNLELVGNNLDYLANQSQLSLNVVLFSLATVLGAFVVFRIGYWITGFIAPILGQIHAFTLIIFALVVGHYWTPKKPISQNKFEFLTSSYLFDSFDVSDFDNVSPFPLTKKLDLYWYSDLGLPVYSTKPNLVMVSIDNLSAQFVNKDGIFKGFTPCLDSLVSNGLLWSNFFANGVTHADALVNLSGSLPYGEKGFMHYLDKTDRNTLFGMLKQNGYQTGFFYGGNSALEQIGLFAEQERVDFFIDQSKFGEGYQLQSEDRAGVTLGYPDLELYRKWKNFVPKSDAPKFFFFMNVSSTYPFEIPKKEFFLNKIDAVVKTLALDSKNQHFFDRNKPLFASIAYADYALERLLRYLKTQEPHRPTIVVVTGTSAKSFPKFDALNDRAVPLVIYAPKIKPSVKTHIASHQDVLPSLSFYFQKEYQMQFPKLVSWQGVGLHEDKNKLITFTNQSKTSDEFIKGNLLCANGKFRKVNQGFRLHHLSAAVQKEYKGLYKRHSALQEYILETNQLVPQNELIYKVSKRKFSKEDMVWINSVFTGSNYDNAYAKARDLAHTGKYERALLLTDYILNNLPTHVDAMVLKGRIYAWQKQYEIAIDILEPTIKKYPHYTDGYEALLDVYYWAGKNDKAPFVRKHLIENKISKAELEIKLERLQGNQPEKEVSSLEINDLSNHK